MFSIPRLGRSILTMISFGWFTMLITSSVRMIDETIVQLLVHWSMKWVTKVVSIWCYSVCDPQTKAEARARFSWREFFAGRVIRDAHLSIYTYTSRITRLLVYIRKSAFINISSFEISIQERQNGQRMPIEWFFRCNRWWILYRRTSASSNSAFVSRFVHAGGETFETWMNEFRWEACI